MGLALRGVEDFGVRPADPDSDRCLFTCSCSACWLFLLLRGDILLRRRGANLAGTFISREDRLRRLVLRTIKRREAQSSSKLWYPATDICDKLMTERYNEDNMKQVCISAKLTFVFYIREPEESRSKSTVPVDI